MRKLLAMAMAFVMTIVTPAWAQQRPDPGADVSVPVAMFPYNTGPVVGIDSAHRETQTISSSSGFFTLAAMLTNDGYRVQDFNSALTPTSLAGISVLVIANPRNMQPPPGGSPLDALSAFTPAEIATLRTWVMNGGALLMVGDHPPLAGGIRDLASAFGFTVNRYGAYSPGWPNDLELFTSTNGGLVNGDLTAGLHQVQTFFGTGFTAPLGATPLLRFPSGWTYENKADPNFTPIPTIADDLRGASLVVGNGRVVLLGEAAQITAQISARELPIGWNAPEARSNKQFTRNIFFWLSTGATPPATVEPVLEGGEPPVGPIFEPPPYDGPPNY